MKFSWVRYDSLSGKQTDSGVLDLDSLAEVSDVLLLRLLAKTIEPPLPMFIVRWEADGQAHETVLSAQIVFENRDSAALPLG